MMTDRRPPIWMPFVTGIGLTLLVVLTLGAWPGEPRALQIEQPLVVPTKLAPEPPPATAPAPPAPQVAPAGGIIVQVTATVAVPTMAPVIVTPTPELSAAEQDARTRAAVEAMRRSTEHLPAQMPGAP
jgi:hypothetical protein